MNTIKKTLYKVIKLLLLALVLLSAAANAQVVPFGVLHSNNTPKVGDYRDGGVVFYVAPTPTDLNGDGTLNQGLVCAVSDQSLGVEWGCRGQTIFGTAGAEIGDGAQNTKNIVNNCGTKTAAYICDNLTLNSYTDWFLPSKEELNQMYLNKDKINSTAEANGGDSFWNQSGFFTSNYWSSTGFFSNEDALSQNFFSSNSDLADRDFPLLVRAIRAF